MELLQNQLDRFEELLVDLLEISRFDAGAAVLDAERIDIITLVERAIDAATPLAERSGMTIRLSSEATTCAVDCDPRRLHRIVRNLIENAAKYTPPGSSIEVGAANDSPDHVDIWVEDDGPGLPPGKEEEIFNKFERGQKENATPGVGLGLAICRAIVEAHGGRIRAENRHNGGSCFVFSLPRGNPPAFDIAEAAALPKDELK